MSMNKIFKYAFIVLELLILTYIISYFVYGVFPIGDPIFWIAVIIEAGLAYLTYRFWIRSVRTPDFRSNRIKAYGVMAVGIILPAITFYSGIDFLESTGYSELFYVCITLGLILSISFRMNGRQISGRPVK